ncbi:MAG: CocE/NonD family hydrolase [Taibaiella sp.]|jgi:hypothetical protein
MKKSLLFSLIALLLQTNLNAREFYFSHTNYKDSTTFAEAIPQLAKELIEQYNKDNSASLDYYDKMRRYTMAARLYQESNLYLDSVRKIMRPDDTSSAKAIGIQYETYANTKMLEPKEHVPFAILFTEVFDRSYTLLTEDAQVLATNYTSADLLNLKKMLDDAKKDCALSDSLSFEKASKLALAYSSYNLYSQTVDIMRRQVKKYDDKVFDIRKEMIRMRDGSMLQAVIARKRAIKTQTPAIFIFNIYQDSIGDLAMAKRYAVKDYVGIVVNTRGKGLSPQAIEPFEHDATDAYDIIDWISKQKWSNKKVGMVGGSYLGFSQWAAAKTLHPALKTIMPQVAVGIGIDYPCYGNIFTHYMLRWIHFVTNNKSIDDTDFGNSQRWSTLSGKWYREGASFRSLDTMDNRYSPIFQRWLKHPSFDEYWQNMVTCGNDFAKIKIPVLTTTGYFDADQIGALYYFKQHYLHNPEADHYLVIGPYDHGGAQRYPGGEVGDYKVDSIATSFNFVDLSVQWFNYTLKGGSKPALLQDKVNYEVMGANIWKHAPSIFAMSNKIRRFYISNTRVNSNYKLTDTAAGIEYIRQEVDMADRSDTTDTGSDNVIGTDISRNNRLTFISVPLEKPIMVNGAFTAQLQLSINKKDIDVVMYLYELMPDGKYFSLSEARQRASYAHDRSKRVLLQPGRKETIPITNTVTTSKLVQKGSRLVVVIGVSKDSYLQINYGTGKDVSDETIKDAGNPFSIKWFTDSYVDIPMWE